MYFCSSLEEDFEEVKEKNISMSWTLSDGDYPTALDDYETDFLKSLTPEDRVRLPEFALYKSKYEGNEYTTAPTQQ